MLLIKLGILKSGEISYGQYVIQKIVTISRIYFNLRWKNLK